MDLLVLPSGQGTNETVDYTRQNFTEEGENCYIGGREMANVFWNSQSVFYVDCLKDGNQSQGYTKDNVLLKNWSNKYANEFKDYD